MPWAKGILFLIMAVVALSSSLRADFEMDAGYGAVSEDKIHFGKLLIGDQGVSDLEPSGLSSDDNPEYQSNKARFRLAEAKLQRLGTYVHCGNDSMTLRVPGPRTPHFLVDQGDGSSVPLSQMPASCGFSLKRVRRDVSLVAPYKGCNVRQQSGTYVLPLIIMGAPVQMSCPVSSRLPKVSCSSSAMTVSLGIRANDVKVKVNGSWQPLLSTASKCSFTLGTVDGSVVVTAPFNGSCWEMKDSERHLPLKYGDQEVTLSCPVIPIPTVPPTTPAANDPANFPPFYPFPYGRPWWYPYPYPGVSSTKPPTTVSTTTTTTPPAQDPFAQQPFPPMYPMPGFNPYYLYSGRAPRPGWIPYYYGFPRPVMNNPKTTPAPTTTTAAANDMYAGYPPFFYGPQSIKSFVPSDVPYPFMSQYLLSSNFAPRSARSISSAMFRPSLKRDE